MEPDFEERLLVALVITLAIFVAIITSNAFFHWWTPISTSYSSTTPSTISQSTCDTREYYVEIVINDENGVDTTPFVDIKDPTGKQVFFGRTDENGAITIPLCSLKKYNVTIMKENPCSILVYPRESKYMMVCK